MKLHLGCGQVYLKGYINIDFPLTKHSVQKSSVADEFKDITKISYPKNSVDEIRLHHVFEHFPRAQACGLLVSWRTWLKPKGEIRLEVPDFAKMTQIFANPFKNPKQKSIAIRHIFGSQEAEWAIHYEGWSQDKFGILLPLLGYTITKFHRSSYKGTYNIEVIASKNSQSISKAENHKRVEQYLNNYLIDSSSTEKIMLQSWMEAYSLQIKNSYAK